MCAIKIKCESCNGSGCASWGTIRNEILSLQSQLLTLNASVKELEKLSRRTPPKHLKEEWQKVNGAKVKMERLKLQIEQFENRRTLLKEAIKETPR